MVKQLLLVTALVVPMANTAAPAPTVVPGAFSQMAPGELFQDGWTLSTLRDTKPALFRLVIDDGQVIVRADADGAASSLARAVTWDTDIYSTLKWRWRVDRVVEKSDISRKEGDDFAARLYVLFDYPQDRLSILERTKLRLIRWWYGDHIPAAAICYVWANQELPGTSVWNAYTSRVRMIVLRNHSNEVGRWIEEQRIPADDFRAAFGEPAPQISGLVLATDTDQTGESVTAWFGDISLDQ